MRAAGLPLAVLAFVPGIVTGQGDPVGPEFRVNTYTTDRQGAPSVATDSAGNFVVVWYSKDQDGSGYGIFGQRYLSSGTPQGPEFRVNTFTPGDQLNPTIAADPSGNFVVVWAEHAGLDGSGYGVFGQRYAASGTALGSEFRVNTYTTSHQTSPSVAASSSNFVVVWTSLDQDGSFLGVFGQRYASSGAPLGPEFRLNTYTTSGQAAATVAADLPGNFVVAWQTYVQAYFQSNIAGQRYDSSGTPLGSEFTVNTYLTGQQLSPSVAADSSGNFVVVWRGPTAGDPNGGIFAQRYASSGEPLGTEVRVNTYTTSLQLWPSVAADSAGNFVVAWAGEQQDGYGSGILGQRFLSSGAPLGPQFRVNSYTMFGQYDPSVSADPSGNFVVIWTSQGQEGSNSGIYGQRYSMMVPVELMDVSVEQH